MGSGRTMGWDHRRRSRANSMTTYDPCKRGLSRIMHLNSSELKDFTLLHVEVRKPASRLSSSQSSMCLHNFKPPERFYIYQFVHVDLKLLKQSSDNSRVLTSTNSIHSHLHYTPLQQNSGYGPSGCRCRRYGIMASQNGWDWYPSIAWCSRSPGFDLR